MIELDINKETEWWNENTSQLLSDWDSKMTDTVFFIYYYFFLQEMLSYQDQKSIKRSSAVLWKFSIFRNIKKKIINCIYGIQKAFKWKKKSLRYSYF